MKNTSFKLSNFETIKCDSLSHNSVCCNDQASSLRSLPGLKHDSMLSEPACSGKPMPGYVNNSSGHDASRPCDKALKISGIHFRCEALRPYDKMVKICGIDFGCDALRCYDKLMIIRGLMVCGEERGGRMVNMLSRGRFRRDLRRRLQKRGMCHLRSP